MDPKSSDGTDTESGYLAGLTPIPPAEAPADAKSTAESSPAAEKPDGNTAPSSSADANQGAKAAPKSILEAVQAAAASSKGLEQTPGSKPTESQTADAKAEADKKAEADEAQAPFHKHPRWIEVQSQLKAAREKADTFDQFLTGVAQAGLSVDEFDAGLAIMAGMKRGDRKALAQLEGYVAQLRAALGEDLSDDLKGAVESGEISEAHARQMAKAKADATLSERRAEASAREAAAVRASAQRDSLARAANAWEHTHQQSDPDWDKKKPLVEREAVALIAQHGQPRTPEEAVHLMKVSLARVEGSLSQFVPAKSRTAPRPTGSASSQHKPQPKNLAEAIRFAAGAA